MKLLSKLIGSIYLKSRDQSKQLRNELEEYSERTEYLFNRIGIGLVFSEADPYSDYWEMDIDIERNRKMIVYSGGSNCNYLEPRINLMSRAVHDYFGHYLTKSPFTFQGEIQSYFYQRNYYPKNLWKILFSEIVGQSAANVTLGMFPEQKIVIYKDHLIQLTKEKLNEI